MGKQEVCSFKVRMCSLQFPILVFFSKKRNVANFSAQVQCKILKVRIMFFNDMTETFFNLEHSTKLKVYRIVLCLLFKSSLIFSFFSFTLHLHSYLLLCSNAFNISPFILLILFTCFLDIDILKLKHISVLCILYFYK